MDGYIKPVGKYAGYSCGKLANVLHMLAGEPAITSVGEFHNEAERLALLNKVNEKAGRPIEIVDYTSHKLPTAEPYTYVYG